MITLTAKINLLSGDNKELSLGSDDLSGNNISSNLSGIVGDKKTGSNPFIIGASKLGDGSTFSDGEDYFIGDQLSDDNGNFATPYTITITGNAMTSLTISFDTANGRHPKSISLYKNAKIIEEFNEEDTISKTVSPTLGNVAELFFSYEELPEYVKSSEDIKIVFVSSTSGFEYVVRDYPNLGGYGITIKKSDGRSWLSLYIEIKFVANRRTEYETIKTYKDDDAIFTMLDLGGEEKISLLINNWNTPNYPIVITGIYTNLTIDICRRNLISISRSIFDRSDLKLPSFGIISNTGNIEFNDTDGKIRDYAEQLLLESGLKCEIKLNNTLIDGASETIGLFETDEWDYDNDNRVVSVSLKDDLEEWQDINVDPINYDPRVVEHKSFKWLYNHLWGITTKNDNYDMLSFDELDSDTQAVLNNTYTQYPLLESGSLWQQWTKLCQVCQLHIYKNNNGRIVCRYNGGN